MLRLEIDPASASAVALDAGVSRILRVNEGPDAPWVMR
jgi:hypothetical protein